jgi:hypothetical protein
MPSYLTPRRYHSMGQGVDLTGIEDQDLAAQLQIASGLANQYCNVDLEHDFRGGSVTEEDHDWKLGNYMWPASGFLWPKHKPLTTLTQLRIYVTNTQYLEIDPARVHYHVAENKLEPLFAEASIGVWAAAQIPIAGFRTPQAHLDYDYGYRFTVIDEQMFSDGAKRWRAQNQFWDSTVEPVVKVNNSVIDTADLTYNYNEGTVDIDDDALTALDISAAEVNGVTASYTYKLPTNIANATALITTSLLSSRAITEKGLQGLSGIKVEEVEIRQSRDSQLARDDIPGLAKQLLTPYRYFHWGA